MGGMNTHLDHKHRRPSLNGLSLRSSPPPSATESVVAFFQENPRFRLLAVLIAAFVLVYAARSTAPPAPPERDTSVYRQPEFEPHAGAWFGKSVHGEDQRQRPASGGALPPPPPAPKDPSKIAIAPAPGAEENAAAPVLVEEDVQDIADDEEDDGAAPVADRAVPDAKGQYNPRFDKFAVALKSGVDVVLERSLIQLMSYLKPVRNLIMIGDGEMQVGDRVMIDVIGDAAGEKRDAGINFPNDSASNSGKNRNAEAVLVDESSQGWKADGHKNLPGFRELWNRFPDAEWFVMIDDDTYVFFDNLADRLSIYDPDGAHYFGAKTQFIGCDGIRQWGAGPYFAHGGSGIVVSRGAMRLMMDDLPNCVEKYRTCWAGDVRTALCLRDQGVLLHSPSGFFSTPPNKQFTFPHDPCERPLTFHHLLVRQIQDLYGIERRINRRVGKGAVTFGDVYWPWHGETELQENFDRKGADFLSAVLETAEDCRDLCEEKKVCVSYVYDGKKCWLKNRIPPGAPGRGFTSGVMRDRYQCNTKRVGFRR
ncbi:hypothetical protein BDZ88DRAFT_462109 [Geranomyces variabilis]|nr:hypothetical protein BDZ88DRAFT_462109 [Geranomyces variabilis]KAJ3140576.1 hypothetical protein HDU90_007876 [Geranomyces variabilis]